MEFTVGDQYECMYVCTYPYKIITS